MKDQQEAVNGQSAQCECQVILTLRCDSAFTYSQKHFQVRTEASSAADPAFKLNLRPNVIWMSEKENKV